MSEIGFSYDLSTKVGRVTTEDTSVMPAWIEEQAFLILSGSGRILKARLDGVLGEIATPELIDRYVRRPRK